MHAGCWFPKRLLMGLVGVFVLWTAAASAQSSQDVAADARLEDALVAYERNHWDEAYAVFSELADAGHRESARIALQMWRHGRTLYGTGFVAGPEQVRRWSAIAACGGGGPASICQMARRANEHAR